ncbi:hypothetical protein IWX49DRAFT_616805 [Phyllosticta citricarpa]
MLQISSLLFKTPNSHASNHGEETQTPNTASSIQAEQESIITRLSNSQNQLSKSVVGSESAPPKRLQPEYQSRHQSSQRQQRGKQSKTGSSQKECANCKRMSISPSKNYVDIEKRSRVVRKLESTKSNFQKQSTAQALEVNRVLSENTEVSRRNEVLEEEAEGYREALMDKMGEVEELRQRNEELRRRNEGLADSSREAMEMWGLRDSLGEEFDDDDNDDEVVEGDWNGDEDDMALWK